MPRKQEVDRPTSLYLMLPTSWRAWLDLYLFSAVEGRVPRGAYQAFFIDRMREFRDSKRLDLAPFIVGVEPHTMIVWGHPSAIEALQKKLSNVA